MLCFIISPFTLSANDIAFVTLAAGREYQEIVAPGVENKKHYCELHGYDFYYADNLIDPSRSPLWGKILLLAKVMENSKYNWVFWSDADSLIMNFDKRLEDLIDENYNLILTADFNGINSGQFFLKNCDWSRQFLEDTYSHTEFLHDPTAEQNAMITEITTKPETFQLTKILPQRTMNSYSSDVFGGVVIEDQVLYQPGDFIIHFASSRKETLRMLMQKYFEIANSFNEVDN